MQQQKTQSFTLIELSIVLVIIGLIVGGILVGQDLIRAAEIRSTIAQLEKYNTAVNTFRVKYNGIPGDLAQASAASFGLGNASGASTPGSAGLGDGNGLVEGGAANASAFNGEIAYFWRQMSDAQLIDGSFGATGTTAGTLVNTGALGAATTTYAHVAALMPQAKLGRNNYIAPAPSGGINYFVMSGILALSTAGVYSGGTNQLNAQEASNIDTKMDDGRPGSGGVWAIDGTAAISTAATLTTVNAVATCVASSAYVVNPGTASSCALRIRFN